LSFIVIIVILIPLLSKNKSSPRIVVGEEEGGGEDNSIYMTKGGVNLSNLIPASSASAALLAWAVRGAVSLLAARVARTR
jgi:hypothetical protein